MEDSSIQQGRVFGIPYDYQIHKKLRIGICVFMLLTIIGCFIGYVHYDPTVVQPEHSFSIGLDLGAMSGTAMLTLVYALDRTKPDESMHYFFILLILCFCSLTTYVVSWLMESWLMESWRLGMREAMNWVIYPVEVMAFFMSPLTAFTLWFYQRSLYPDQTRETQQLTKLLTVLLAVDLIYIVTSAYTGFLFIIDETGNYIPKDGYAFTMLYPFFCLICCLLANLQREIPLRKRISLLAFCLTPIIAAISTLFIRGYTYTHVVTFFVLLLIYGTIQMERSIELMEHRQELLERQTQLMLSQIQPHFLYNTLNVISGLCEEDPELARDTVDHFASYMRMNMKSLQSECLVPFEKELHHTELFVWIEQQRFGEDVQVVYDIRYRGFHLPSLTLQPMVENAIRHGICKREYGGTVTISTYRQEDRIYLVIHDDGVGFDISEPPKAKGIHLGLENVRARLAAICRGTLTIESTPNVGTTVTIMIPVEE